MGIRGLKTFVNEHFRGWKVITVQGEVIIDGFSLLHALYTESGEDPKYGGDYVNFSRHVEQFLNYLTRCGVQPFVVFDGIDCDRTKRITHSKRRLEDASRVHGLLSGFDPEAHVSPYLSRLVMIETVARVLGKDRFCVTDGDADAYIAYLGSVHKSPVLSDDSDFFIFHLASGYIPYYKFTWGKGDIKAHVFYYKDFIKQMNIKDATLLILLPSIVGNDVLPPLDDVIRKVIRKELFRIDAIIRYISNFANLGDAKRAISQITSNALKNVKEAHKMYYGAVDSFRSNPDHKTILKNHFRGSSDLPEFFIAQFRSGEVPKLVMDAVCLGDVEHKVCLEDSNGSWCHLIGEPIRKVIYGILCGKDVQVSEHCRRSGKISEFVIESVMSVQLHGYESVQIESLPGCPVPEKKYILFSALGCKIDDFTEYVSQFSTFGPDLSILLAITHFWYRFLGDMEVANKQKLLGAFLLTLIKSLIVNPPFPSKALVKGSSYPLVAFVHAFAQWQSVYHDAYCLNKLLLEPVTLYNVSSFFSSIVIYQYLCAITQSGIHDVIVQCGFAPHKRLFDAFFDAVVHA